MEHDIFSQSNKDLFVAKSERFLHEFETSFIEYFTQKCTTSSYALSKDEAREIGSSLYHALFKSDFDIEKLRHHILEQMGNDTILANYLVSRSLFFMIDHYSTFIQKEKIVSHIKLLIIYLNHFIEIFEHKPKAKTINFASDFEGSFGSDVMFTPTNTIIDTFRQMKLDDEKVVFLNLYKGVPIRSEAIILSVNDESVTFRVDRLQEIAMKLDGQGFIVKNDHFNKHLKADIVSSDFQNNTVILKNFIYLSNMPALQREFIRVHPDILANVYLSQSGYEQTKGRLFDLSKNGLGVVSDENHGISVGSRLIVQFELNSSSIMIEGDRMIEVEGEVVNVISYKNSYRYCMRIFPDTSMREKLSIYINKREQEILIELEQELEGMCYEDTRFCVL